VGRRRFPIPGVEDAVGSAGAVRSVMSASSGEKRRRRRERRFLELQDTLSIRSTVVAIAATCGFLLLQAARLLLNG
jgi:hypothetical protein